MKHFTLSFGSCKYNNGLHFFPSSLPIKQIIDFVGTSLEPIGICPLLQYHYMQIRIVFVELKKSIMKEGFVWTAADLLLRKKLCDIIFYISFNLLKKHFELLGLHLFSLYTFLAPNVIIL